MPFARPTLKVLKQQTAQDISAALPGSDPLLRFSNLGIIGKVLANLINLVFGYIDWIARQAVPWTATDEYLLGWAALKNVTLKPATPASGTNAVTFNGVAGTVLPAGTPIARGDGASYTTTADGTVSVGGTVVVSVIADAAGSLGNTNAGTAMTLAQAIAGIQANGTATTALTGGADLETMDSLRSRTLKAYAQPPQGGAPSDYEEWALEVSGVTRAWCVRNGMGPGTVVVYFMMDVAQAAHNGFPQGTFGVATGETRDTAATGDQLTVANYFFAPTRQPVTALVYAAAPTPQAINFTISGLSTAGSAVQSAVASAIAGVLLQYGSAKGGVVDLSYIESAIGAVPGSAGFVISVPNANISIPVGSLPVLGTITWT